MNKHKRKLAIAAAAAAAFMTAVPRSADGQNVYNPVFTARSVIVAPVVISPTQWTINNPTLSRPTLTPILAAPTLRTPLVEHVLPSVAVPAVAPALAAVSPAVVPAAAVPVAAPVAGGNLVIPVPVAQINTAAPADQQRQLNAMFDNSREFNSLDDFSDLERAVQGQAAEADNLRQNIAAENANRMKSEPIQLSREKKIESNDYTMSLEEIRSTSDGMGEAHITVSSKHSKEKIDLHVKNGESKLFTIVNIRERWQKVFSVRVVSLNDPSGTASIEIYMTMETEIYTAAAGSLLNKAGIDTPRPGRTSTYATQSNQSRNAEDNLGKPKDMAVGDYVDFTYFWAKLERIAEDGTASFHIVSGESEGQFDIRPLQKKHLTIEVDGYERSFEISCLGISQNGKMSMSIIIVEE